MRFSRLGIEEFLNPAEEDEQVIEMTTFDSLVRNVAGVEGLDENDFSGYDCRGERGQG